MISSRFEKRDTMRQAILMTLLLFTSSFIAVISACSSSTPISNPDANPSDADLSQEDGDIDDDGAPPVDADLDATVDADFDHQRDADLDDEGDGSVEHDGDIDSDIDMEFDGDIDEAPDSGCEGGVHDEDGDSIVDDCDNCPTRFNPFQENADDDELGSYCESYWGYRIHSRILEFDPFIELGEAWTVRSGDWEQSDDLVTGTTDGVAMLLHSDTLGPIFSVETVLRRDALSEEGVEPRAGIIFAANEVDDGLSYWSCIYSHETRRVELWSVDATEGESLIASGNVLVEDDLPMFIIAMVQSRLLGCRVVTETGQYSITSIELEPPLPNLRGRTGLIVSGQTASFGNYIMYR